MEYNFSHVQQKWTLFRSPCTLPRLHPKWCPMLVVTSVYALIVRFMSFWGYFVKILENFRPLGPAKHSLGPGKDSLNFCYFIFQKGNVGVYPYSTKDMALAWYTNMQAGDLLLVFMSELFMKNFLKIFDKIRILFL